MQPNIADEIRGVWIFSQTLDHKQSPFILNPSNKTQGIHTRVAEGASQERSTLSHARGWLKQKERLLAV